MTEGARDNPEDPAIGKDYDGYRIQEVLGRGGMGIVYRAEDTALSRTVALKMIDPSLAGDEAFLRRFKAEARALARIDSPHIVGVYTLRKIDNGLFIVMEYVEGGTVADITEAGPLPWKRVVQVTRQILQALHDAHSVGVTHRDIKPRNIMLSKSGNVKVTDFGLAKLHERGRESTATQGIAGTLYYMSPEQVKASRDLDHRTDLYSLGVMAYEMLTGRLPVERGADEFTVMKQIVEQTFDPPSALVRNLPPDLDRVVMKALEKEPEKRYQSATEMIEALEALPMTDAADRTVIGDSYRPGSDTHKRTMFTVGLAAPAVILIGIIGFALYGLSGGGGSIAVQTDPPGATVLLNGRVLGQTPLPAYSAEAGEYLLRLEMNGYQPVDTLVLLQGGASPVLQLVLERDRTSATGALSIRSTPPGAEVFLADRNLGTTPLSVDDVEPGLHTLEVRRSGYSPTTRENIPVEAGEVTELEFNLQETGTAGTPSPPARASLRVDSEGTGPISVNGNPVAAGNSVTLNAGRHEVQCGDGDFAETRQVDLAADQTGSITCYFVHTLNVAVEEIDGDDVHVSWATLYVNDEPRSTMSNELGPGSHDVRIRREFYEPVFGDTTITVRAGFEPSVHRITFQIRRES